MKCSLAGHDILSAEILPKDRRCPGIAVVCTILCYCAGSATVDGDHASQSKGGIL
jgi:hypothetical protein